MTKSELRKKYIKIREDILNKDSLSKKIADKLFSHEDYIKARTIGIYSSFGSEVDTKHIINQALLDGKVVGIPKINKDSMEFYKIKSLDDLIQLNVLGIKEPKEDSSYLLFPESFDLIIVPGLCFDLKNNRLGFGKGYYDKYLSRVSKDTVKTGICFEEQVLKDSLIPVDNYDIQIDKIIFL